VAPFDKHLFICCNQRPPGHPRGCCDPTASDALQKAFKKALADRGLTRLVRANKSGCLDQCEHGPNVVVYPDGVWYGGVTLADVADIIDQHIIGGRPVERLRLPDECVNTPNCAHKPRSTGVQGTGVQSTGVQTTNVQTTEVQSTGVQTTAVQSTLVQTTDVQGTGVQSTNVQTTNVQTTGVQTTNVQTTNVQTTEVQTTEVQTTGVQTTDVQSTGPQAASLKPQAVSPKP
jgi:(2Fe-2S) ferredoxin